MPYQRQPVIAFGPLASEHTQRHTHHIRRKHLTSPEFNELACGTPKPDGYIDSIKYTHIFFVLCCRVSVSRGRLRWRTRSRVACQMMFCRPAQSQFSRTSRHCADDDDDDADADSVGIGTRPLAMAAVRKYKLVDAGVYNRTYATHVSHITLSQCVRGVVCMCCNLRLCVADADGDVRTNPKLDKSVDTVRLYLPK